MRDTHFSWQSFNAVLKKRHPQIGARHPGSVLNFKSEFAIGGCPELGNHWNEKEE